MPKGLVIGAAKEAVDEWGLFYQRPTGWDWWDLAFTALGGLATGILFHFLPGIRKRIGESKTIAEIFRK